MKELIPLDKFIETNLSQNCINMVGHIQKNQLLPVIEKYLATQNDHPPQSLLTLRVKLFDYHSCMRNFDVCDRILAEIDYQLNSTTFQNGKINAQYLIAKAYQHRNYKPTENFELSEKNYQASEALSLNLINKVDTSETEKQECIDLLFNAKISRFWLYANYSKNMEKAKNTLKELQEILSKTSVPAYRLAYCFFVGAYYLKNENYKAAIDTLKRAEEEKSSDETDWFFGRLNPLIKEKIKDAEKAYSESLSNYGFLSKSKEPVFFNVPSSLLTSVSPVFKKSYATLSDSQEETKTGDTLVFGKTNSQ
ncbi:MULTISPECIES: hypothetical protein [unclassified Legionella]|uniref:hypothetical protein n=1 Tax=unclassified Legionella TaxID=2622702 RepID=UPI0010554C17|nr:MULTISPECIES: hypothetical protein [unclassified Legionella]MDI9818787.1 hypothetical protein [Legionella sp. PL877]